MGASKAIGPTDPRVRLRSVDAVRGFALFGVLLVNMYNFGAYSPEWTGLGDRISFTAMHAVFETKSWRLFSLLFGFGFALQMMKVESHALKDLAFYFRRLIILFGIGALHALFYDGDILMEYALLGMILVFFRRVPKRLLLVLSLVLLAAFPVGSLIEDLGEPAPVAAEEEEDLIPLAERREGHAYLGTIGDVFEANAEAIPPRIWTNLGSPESSLAVFAMFLLGLWVGRSRLIHDAPQHLPFIRRIFGWAMGIGVSAAVGEWLLGRYFGYTIFRDGGAGPGVQFLGNFLFAYGATALAIGYGSGIILLARRGNWQTILRPFENLGRMALTVYLSGTVMFTLLFYGYGFGQIFLIGPTGTTLYALLFFAIQIAFCAVWLKYFHFGPVEWLWRSLTYGRLPPLRLREA